MTDEPTLARSPEATERAGEALARRLQPGDVVLLQGDLAAGKTTLTRGLVRGLAGDPDDVSSPSFVLLQTYPVAAPGIAVVHHLDLYRLGEELSDLREVGVEEVLNDPRAVCVVEWPKATLATWLPAGSRVWRVTLEALPDDGRRLTVSPPAE